MKVIWTENEHYVLAGIIVGECFRINNAAIYMRVYCDDKIKTQSGYIPAVALTSGVVTEFRADTVVIPVKVECKSYDCTEGSNDNV